MNTKPLLSAILGMALLASAAEASSAVSVSGNTFSIKDGVDASAIQDIKDKAGAVDSAKMAFELAGVDDKGLADLCAAFPGMARLTVDKKNKLTSLAPLAGMKNLRHLTIVADGVSDFSPLSGLAELTSLRAESRNMSDVKWTSGLSRLTSLYLSGGPKLTSLEGLPSLPELEEAWITNASPKDITPIVKAFPGIRTLNLHYCTIADLSPLAQASELVDLKLYGVKVKDFSPLAACPKLSKLMYYAAEGCDWSTLGKLNQVTELHGGLTKLSDISWVSEMKSLKLMNIFAEYVTDLSPLAKSTVETLKIGQSRVPVDFASLAGAPSLKSLEILHIKDLSGLAGLSSLPRFDTLKLDQLGEEDEVVDISIVKSLPGLRNLTLTEINAASTEPLAALAGLKSLVIEDSKTDGGAFDLAFLSKLQGLTSLDIDETEVDNFEAVADAKALVKVDLSDISGVDDLEPLTKLPALKELAVPEDLTDDGRIEGLPKSVELDVR